MEIVTGRKLKPFNVILAGTPGVGKSTWADHSPKPIFLGAEDNESLQSSRMPIPDDFTTFLKQLQWLLKEKHDYKTVVIDTIDSIEKLIHKKILATDPKGTSAMGKAHGGYGSAYDIAERDMIVVREHLRELRDKRGMHIAILAHTKKTKADDTIMGLSYDTYELALHTKAQAVWVDWVSAVLFATYRSFKKDDQNTDKVFAMGDGERICFTEKRPGHIGKNRYDLPYEMPFEKETSFQEFFKKFEEFYAGKQRTKDEITKSILGKAENVRDPVRRKKIIDAVKDADLAKLERIDKQVDAIIETAENVAGNQQQPEPTQASVVQ